jgi:glutamate-ammonia-ligase adenylyltransferase
MSSPAKEPAREPVAGGHSLARRISRAPHSSKAGDGAARLREWLDGIARIAPGNALKKLFRAHPAVEALIAGLADGSPYLWDLVRADPARLVAALESDPDARLTALLDETARAVACTQNQDEAMRLLRRMKAEASLLIALSDIGGVWPVMQVTRALTAVADNAVCTAVKFLLAEAAQRDRLKPENPAHPDQGSGYIVLAMGKMGAFELNYSSDIDLIVFFDPAAPALANDVEAASLYIRMTRSLVKLLQARTANGYVFRVDLRLRPDPASTQIAVSTAAALDYYESVGQNWERAAMIKARPCAGDIAAGEAILRDLSPFVWRKYMDFVALADIHAMKRQIHAYKGHGEIAVSGHNIKLGRGGIREIEFFVQTQQLVAGGRHPELRDRETLTTLAKLADGGWIDATARADLEAAYCFLRIVEHRLQMVNDEQTHTLPTNLDDLEKFARFLGFDDADEFSDVLVGHMRKVQAHYARLFEASSLRAPGKPALVFPPDADDRATLDSLAEMGFRNALDVSVRVRGWLSGAYPSLRSELAREHLRELAPALLDQLSTSENRDAALIAFDRFLAGLHGGGRLFSLLRQNPDLLALIALTIGSAPRLADILAHYPQVMDALIDPTFFGTLPEAEKLNAGLARTLALSSSYEDFLDRLRLFAQEHMFLIGARILSGTVSAEQAGDIFARLADVIVRALHCAVENRFAETHGRIPGQHTALIALGKLGGREMTATSDLDLILVYDFNAAHPESDGARPLYGSQYFARLTQRLISALTAQTNYGRLYDVDMRLRPSGRSGPLATQIDSFASYQESEAWTWEHMALTRARVVSASPEFAARIEGVIANVLRRPRDAETICGDVVEMRRAIATEKGDESRWELKYVAGGLIDIEFIAQYLELIHAAEHPDILDTSTARVLEKAARLGLLSAEDAEVLRPAVRLYHDLGQILRLCLTAPFDPKTAGPDLLALLARAGDMPDFATLEAYVIETQAKVRQSFVRILDDPRR